MSIVMRATIADLASTRGKAELIGGRIVPIMPAGSRPGLIADGVDRSLFAHASTTGQGMTYTDNLGYAVPELISGRESFSPNASYFSGPLPSNERDFLSGAPAFGVEVRGKGDHGDAAEAEMAAKRGNDFEAGTVIVWDVDPKAQVIRS